MGGTLLQVDIGHGRGWLETEAAKSLARVDHALGHPLQITEAGRDYAVQDAHYQRYLRYLKGGPWAPIALAPWTPSVHQKGRAIDTNERPIRLLNDHGWHHTVYRWMNGRWTLVEPWHFKYFPDRDNHKNSLAGGGEGPFDPEYPVTQHWKDTIMRIINTTDKKTWLVGPGATVHIRDPQERDLLVRVLNSDPATPDTFTPEEQGIIDRYMGQLTDQRTMNAVTIIQTTEGKGRVYLVGPGGGAVHILNGTHFRLLERYLKSGTAAIDTFTKAQKDIISDYLTRLR